MKVIEGEAFDTPAAASDAPGVPRELAYGRYVLPDPFDPSKGKWINTKDHGRVFGRIFTRTTTFAKSISDNYTLNLWAGRMAAKGLALSPPTVLYRLEQLDVTEDRDEINAIVATAQELAGSKVRASIGTMVHNYTEQMDAGQHPEVPALYAAELASWDKMIEHTGMEILSIERVVCAPQYDLAGTYDRIVRFKRDIVIKFPGRQPFVLPAGTPVIVDLKTGRDLSYGWGEIAIQLTVYTDAPIVWVKAPISKLGTVGHYEDKIQTSPDVGFVIHVPIRDDPTGPATAVLYAIDLETGRAGVELASNVRLWRKMRSLVTPITRVKVTQAEAAAVYQRELTGADYVAPTAIALNATWEDRIRMASSPAELSAIWREAFAQRAWTPELEALGHQQIAKLSPGKAVTRRNTP